MNSGMPLTQNQHGLCAYCETVIKGMDRQIEHVIPQSDDEMRQSEGSRYSQYGRLLYRWNRIVRPVSAEDQAVVRQREIKTTKTLLTPGYYPPNHRLPRYFAMAVSQSMKKRANLRVFLPLEHVTRTD